MRKLTWRDVGYTTLKYSNDVRAIRRRRIPRRIGRRIFGKLTGRLARAIFS